jgi:hypothetical protein
MKANRQTRVWLAVAFCFFVPVSAPTLAQPHSPQSAPQSSQPADSEITAPRENKESKETERTKATRDAKESKEVKETLKEQPPFWVGMAGVLAWPFVAIVAMALLLLNFRRIRRIVGVAAPFVRRVSFGSFGVDFDFEALRAHGEQTREGFRDLVARAGREYELVAAQQEIRSRLAATIRTALPRILRENNLPLPDLRATVYVPDIVFENYLYQLTDYFPDPGAGGKAGRLFSQRFGIIGRAWRLSEPMGRGNVIHSADNKERQLVEHWGMTYEEALRSHSRQNPADACVILRGEQADDSNGEQHQENLPTGLLFIDSKTIDAFGNDQKATDVARQLGATPEAQSLARALYRAMSPLRLPRIKIEST